MRHSNDSDAAYDAACETTSNERKAAINENIENDSDFAWRWRIVESARAKLPSLRVTDPIKAKSLARRIKHLEKYCDGAIDATLEANADAASEAMDPYAYRGLSRLDFI